jgi:hypothetical protein
MSKDLECLQVFYACCAWRCCDNWTSNAGELHIKWMIESVGVEEKRFGFLKSPLDYLCVQGFNLNVTTSTKARYNDELYSLLRLLRCVALALRRRQAKRVYMETTG